MRGSGKRENYVQGRRRKDAVVAMTPSMIVDKQKIGWYSSANINIAAINLFKLNMIRICVFLPENLDQIRSDLDPDQQLCF